MHTRSLITIGLLLLTQGENQLRPDPPIVCDACDGWNRAQTPFRIFGNAYYVGIGGLSAILVATDDGHILLDGGLPQSAALIDANIRTLGFRTQDIRLIVNSHAHFDHAGGIAALQRASRATVAASPAAAEALRTGRPTADDPQFAYGGSFPAVGGLRVVQDGETLSVGDQEITVRFTPGHTPGGTSWTWRSCEGARCLDMVYADSLTAVSAPDFRYTGDDTHPSIVETFQRSIDTVAALPCDVMVSTHPEFSNLFDKLGRRDRGIDPDALIDAQGCREYAAGAAETLERRIAEEQSAAR